MASMNELIKGRKVQGIIYYKNQVGGLSILGLHRTPEEGGFWQPLTGTVEAGESYQECLVRELQEETGITSNQIIKIDGPINTFEWSRDNTLYEEHVYSVEVSSETQVRLSEEHDEYQWVTPDETKVMFKFQEIKDGIDILNGKESKKN